jgi:hypothetical protein
MSNDAAMASLSSLSATITTARPRRICVMRPGVLDVRSGVPVKGEDALVVTAVVAAGVGDGRSGGARSAMSMR